MSAVDQRAGMGASRIRRLLTRALLVVGGTMAGTAVAWVLSTTTASAEVPNTDAVSAVTAGSSQRSMDELLPVRMNTARMNTAFVPVTQAVEDIDQALRAQQDKARAATPPQLDEVADGLRDAFGQMGIWFQPRSASAEVAGKPAKHVTGASQSAEVVDTAPVSVGSPVVQGSVTPFGKFGNQLALVPFQSSSTLPDDLRSDLPGDPFSSPFAPFAPPVNAPVHCACGGDGSGSAGSQNAASQAAFVNAYHSAVARALKPTTERISVLPGKQPGSTPD